MLLLFALALMLIYEFFIFNRFSFLLCHEFTGLDDYFHLLDALSHVHCVLLNFNIMMSFNSVTILFFLTDFIVNLLTQYEFV